VPKLGVEARLGDGVLGLLLGVYMFAGLLACVPFGVLADRWKPRTMLIIGVIGLSVGSAATAIFPTPVGIGISRFMQGLAGSAIWTAGLAAVNAAVPTDRRGREVGIAFAMATLGEMLGPLVSGFLAERFGFAAFFWFMAGLAALLAGVLLVWKGSVISTQPVEPDPAEQRPRSFQMSVMVMGGVLSLLITVVYGMLLLLVPLKLSRELGLTEFSIGQVLVVWNLALFGSQILGGHWADAAGRRWPLALGLLVMGAGILSISRPAALLLVVAPIIVAGLGEGVAATSVTPLFTDAWEAVKPAGSGLGLAYGVANMIWSLGFLLGNSTGGWLLTRFRLNGVLLGVGIVVLTVGLATLLFRWRWLGATPPPAISGDPTL
jgi:MFS family permease